MEIAIALKHDRTQIVTGRENKEQIEVKSADEIEPIVALLHEANTFALDKYFKQLAEHVPKKANMRISIPSEMAIMNCRSFETVSENFFKQEIDRVAIRLLGLKEADAEQFNIDKALIIKQRNSTWVTSVAVPKKIINMLWNACVQHGLNLICIETDAVASLRCDGYEAPCGYIEVDANGLTLTGSLPLLGMFSIRRRWSQDRQNITNQLDQAIELFDQAAQETFGKNNYKPVPLYIDQRLYSQYQNDAYKERLMLFKEPTELIRGREGNLINYITPCGLLLNRIFERRAKREKKRIPKFNRQ